VNIEDMSRTERQTRINEVLELDEAEMHDKLNRRNAAGERATCNVWVEGGE
jgi:hypothetical protein